MSNLTATQIQRLLDQATPGPWEYEGPQFQEITTLDQEGLEQSVISLDRYSEKETCNRPADMNLAAHAPQLAQEVLRMRRELESMQSAWLLMYADPEYTPTEQDFAAHVVDHIDSVLGDHDE